MEHVLFEDVWDELKNQNEDSKIDYETAEEMSRVIVELIEARVERGYSQRQLASKCGIKQSAIARMESLRSIPRLDTIIRVAKALGVVISVDRVTAEISGLKDLIMSDKNVFDFTYTYISSGSEIIKTGEYNEIVG